MGRAAEIVRKWVELYNDGTPEYYGSDRFLDLYAPDCDWQESPSQYFPSGRTGNPDALRQALILSSEFLRNRKVVLHEIIEEGDVASWRADFMATVGADGLDMPIGSRFRLRMAVFTEVQNGLIVRQYEHLASPEVI